MILTFTVSQFAPITINVFKQTKQLELVPHAVGARARRFRALPHEPTTTPKNVPASRFERVDERYIMKKTCAAIKKKRDALSNRKPPSPPAKDASNSNKGLHQPQPTSRRNQTIAMSDLTQNFLFSTMTIDFMAFLQAVRTLGVHRMHVLKSSAYMGSAQNCRTTRGIPLQIG